MSCFNLGQRIKHLRKKRKIKQIELAKIMNLTQPMISKIEAGVRHVDLDNELPLILKALKCTPNDLFLRN